MTAFIANTNLLDLTGLKSAVDSLFINDAAVTVTIKDAAGVVVTGVTWPVTMSYLAASNGNYRATLSHLLVLLHKKKYTAFIEANAGANRIGHFEFEFKPLTREIVEA